MSAVLKIRPKVGVVVSSGKMMKTVKVRVAKQKWNSRIQKYYDEPYTILASDPTESVREGDVIQVEGGNRSSKQVRHVVTGIIAPMGPPLSERPPIPTEVQRLAAKEAERTAKDIIQAAKGRSVAIQRIKLKRREENEHHLAKLVEDKAKRERLLEKNALNIRKIEDGEQKKVNTLEMLIDRSGIPAAGQRLKRVISLVQWEAERRRAQAPKLFWPLEGQDGQQVVSSLESQLEEAALFVESESETLDLLNKEFVSLTKSIGSIMKSNTDRPVESLEKLQLLESAVQITRQVLPIAEHQAQLKIGRIKKYLKRVEGKEKELREADFKYQTLLSQCQRASIPRADKIWVAVAKEVGLTWRERKAARIGLHGKDVQSKLDAAMEAMRQNASKKSTEETKAEDINRSDEVRMRAESETQELPKKEKRAKQPIEGKQPVEEQKGGVFGWFSR